MMPPPGVPDSASAPRPLWAIGDVQGCLGSLQALVSRIDALEAPRRPRFRLVGDLVNRGPASLETLRWAIANESRIVSVLGNHDLHLLAVAAGIRPQHRTDTLSDILAAPDRELLIDWIRRRPLAHLEDGWLLVHAGVLPQWDAPRTVELSEEVRRVLSGDRWVDFLRVMYGNLPARWDDRLAGADRLRVIVNALTRLRFCTADGTMEFSTKEGAGGAPPGHMPWFDVPGRACGDTPVVFGHWSTLGYIDRPDLLAIDTGCVWGGTLTAVRLDDRLVVSERCPRSARPMP
jgi:bis(5'-nucleosyl)-tetraphosphatase (symmetrical)